MLTVASKQKFHLRYLNYNKKYSVVEKLYTRIKKQPCIKDEIKSWREFQIFFKSHFSPNINFLLRTSAYTAPGCSSELCKKPNDSKKQQKRAKYQYK